MELIREEPETNPSVTVAGRVTAGVVMEETNRHELESIPGGWIETRTMTWAERNKRIKLSQDDVKVTRHDRKRNTIWEGWGSSQDKVNFYEFQTVIIRHNLDLKPGVPLDFSNREHYSNLQTKVGSEIEKIIRDENQLDQEDLEEDSEE